jgi:hypothetical protein
MTTNGGTKRHNPKGPEQARTLNARRRFLQYFAVTGNVSLACRHSNVPRRTVYRWLAQNQRFRAIYNEALEIANDLLEEEARRRAVDGVLKPVYYRGKKVGNIRKYSDPLLLWLLKMKRPELYGERPRQTSPSGSPSAPAVIHVSYVDDGRSSAEPSTATQIDQSPTTDPKLLSSTSLGWTV